MVKTIARLLNLSFSRIQFTPDLMPADILGVNILMEGERGTRQFEFQSGPVFTNILLADEINRATPETQSALLQVMEERQVTIFGTTYTLEDVFMTLATQNPIELKGTYPLPEAQLDRFMFKLSLPSPSQDELVRIARVNIEAMGAAEIARKYVRYGASPRGLISLLAAAKASAFLDGCFNLAWDDLKENFLACLRHRVLLNFEAQVQHASVDDVLREIFEQQKRPA